VLGLCAHLPWWIVIELLLLCIIHIAVSEPLTFGFWMYHFSVFSIVSQGSGTWACIWYHGLPGSHKSVLSLGMESCTMYSPVHAPWCFTMHHKRWTPEFELFANNWLEVTWYSIPVAYKAQEAVPNKMAFASKGKREREKKEPPKLSTKQGHCGCTPGGYSAFSHSRGVYLPPQC
jgi:hypothetical protein